MLHMATVAKRGSQWRPDQPQLRVNPAALFIDDGGREKIHSTQYQLMLRLRGRQVRRIAPKNITFNTEFDFKSDRYDTLFGNSSPIKCNSRIYIFECLLCNSENKKHFQIKMKTKLTMSVFLFAYICNNMHFYICYDTYFYMLSAK